eukprot:c5577_g1_i2 orf=444-899(+)
MSKTFSYSIPIKVSPNRMWFAVIKDAHNCLPKCAPDRVASVEYEGNSDVVVGKVRTIKFHGGARYLKGRIEEVDEEKLSIKIRITGGGFLGVLFESYEYTYEFKEGTVKWIVDYEEVGGGEASADVELAKQETVGFIKAAEAYLLQSNDYA